MSENKVESNMYVKNSRIRLAVKQLNFINHYNWFFRFLQIGNSFRFSALIFRRSYG